MPVAATFGIDSVHLGIIMMLNLGIELLTPPMGLNFLMASMTFKEKFSLVTVSELHATGLRLLILTLVSSMPWLYLALI